VGAEIVAETLEWLKDVRIKTVSLADTVGTASPQLVGDLYREVKDHVAGIELGVHLHSRPENAEEKILAAYEAGCRRFDGALTDLAAAPLRETIWSGTSRQKMFLQRCGKRAPIRNRFGAAYESARNDERDSREVCARSSGELESLRPRVPAERLPRSGRAAGARSEGDCRNV